MKKYFFIALAILTMSPFLFAQPDKTKYPEPEFSNEVYYLKKDSMNTAVRLEKGSSKMETKTKMGGMGGSESGYILDGEKSTVRLSTGNNLSFIISKGGGTSMSSSPRADSMMKANGINPSEMSGMMGSMNDPSSTITLYKAETEKGKRKIYMMKSGGAMPFSSHKMQSSDKYTFSVRKIREGYWELVIDKTLPKGEYAFSMMGMGMGNMDGSTTLFAFAVE
jgi:hypothetical protein